MPQIPVSPKKAINHDVMQSQTLEFDKHIYLDNAATTKISDEVLHAMAEALKYNYGNPSSLHTSGIKAKNALENARSKIADLINADPSEIFFTSGATESINTIIKQVAHTFRHKGNHIITSNVEHLAVLNTCRFLEENGFEVTYVKPDKFGMVNPADIESAITENNKNTNYKNDSTNSNTILVSIMHANNEIGTIQPIEEIAQICKQHGVLFHTDAVQTFGKLPIDVKKINIDFLNASSHKLHGPKGAGLLYIQSGTKGIDGVRLVPLLHGGTQENSMRPGTENIPAIIGFAKSVEIAQKNIHEENAGITKLRNRLITTVLKKIDGSSLNGHPTQRLPNNAHFSFKFVEGEQILKYLDAHGIEVSTGSACTSRNLEPSHVLKAINLKAAELHGSVRITLSRYTTEDEIDYCAQMLEEAVKKLRKM